MLSRRGPKGRAAPTHLLRLASIVVTITVVGAGLAVVVDVAAVAAAPATVLVNETFSGATVGDTLIRGTGAACLTGATANTSQLNACPVPQSGPVPARGATPGYLQLTDASASKAGAVFYNRPIPARAGVDATFELYQYGGTGADGITFFLVDGATQLTATGGLGGSLGYAQRYNEVGIVGGYLGIGFDVFGNFFGDGENRGKGCPDGQHSPTAASGAIAANAVVVRGPGAGPVGYCYLASTTNPVPNPNGTRSSTLPGKLSATTLATAKRIIHVVVTPDPSPLITVQIDFGGGDGFQTVINNLAAPAGTPSTYKFGFSGSTGGVTDVHLLRNVVVGTVVPLESLNLVKQVDRQTPLAPVLVAGSSIPYQFVVTNAGLETVHGVAVNDATVGTVTCFTADVPPAPDPASTVVCTGTHVVTAADVLAGQVVNTATATALSPADTTVTSNQYSVTVPSRATLGLSTVATTAGPYRVGQSIGYAYTVTNTGNAPLTNVAVADNRVAKVSCPVTSLAPAATVTCTGGYTVLLADIAAAGTLTNTATASATTAIGQTASSAAATSVIPVAADLTLSKVVDNAKPIVGSNVVFTVTVTNLGPSIARTVVVSDPLPTGTTGVSVVPSMGTYVPATGSWSIPTLAVNQSATLTRTDRVDTPNAVVNNATVAGAEQPDLTPGNGSASVIVNPIVPTTDLAVVKTFDNDAIRVGETGTATITVTNTGPFPATDVTVRDPLPSLGATFVSAVGAGSYDPATGIWTVGDLPFPGTASIRLTGRATATGFVLNTAALATVSPVDINPANDVATAPLTVDKALADLAVATNVRPADSALVGDAVSFVVSATNNGPGTAPSVVVADSLPAGLTFVSAAPEQGTFDSTTGQWSVGALAPGVTVSLELFTTATTAGHQSNRAAITDAAIIDPDGSNNAANAGLQINPPPVPPVDIAVTVQRAPTGDVTRGAALTFTITASNSGPNTATGVQFLDVLPPGVQFDAAEPSQGTYDEVTGLWAVGTIAVGAQPTLSISVTVTGGPGDNTNTVSLTAVDQVDTDNETDSATVSWHVAAEADLAVTKTVSPNTAGPSDLVTYTVTVTNNGPEPDTGVQLVETNRTPAVFTSIVATKGTFDAPSLVWTIGDLAVSESATITVTVFVTTPAHVLNRTVVFSADLPDPNLLNNEATGVLDVPGADLALTQTVDHATPAIGTPVTFTIDITNNGPDAAVGATVSDPLPSGLTLESASATVGTYDSASGLWSVGDLLPGGTGTLMLTALPSIDGTFPNMASATAPAPPDFDPTNNSAAATVTVQPAADLSWTKTAVPPADGLVAPGDSYDYTIAVANHGPSTAADVAVTDPLPGPLSFVSSVSGCTATGGLVTCPTIATLATGASPSFTFTVRLDPAYTGDGSDLGNSASVRSSTPAVVPDPTPPPAPTAPPTLTTGATVDVSGLKFVPVTPTRILDTRDGTGGVTAGKVPAAGSVSVSVIGGEVPGGARAVALNLTTTLVDGPGYVTAWPAGEAMPPTSNLNVSVGGETATNGAVLAVGAGGRINLFTYEPAHLVADLTGYWIAAGATTDGRLHPAPTPTRLMDTRDGTGGKTGLFAPNSQYDLQITGPDVPADASAVVLTVTYTGATEPGFLTLWPAGTTRPTVSIANPNGLGDIRSNLAVVKIGAGGKVSIYSDKPEHVVIDLVAYFSDEPGTAGLYTAASPRRVEDSRLADQPFGRVAAGSTAVMSLNPILPPNAAVVLYNLTATQTLGAGYVTAYRSERAKPLASSVNWSGSDQHRAALTGSSVGATRSLKYYASSDTDLVIDIAGWFT